MKTHTSDYEDLLQKASEFKLSRQKNFEDMRNGDTTLVKKGPWMPSVIKHPIFKSKTLRVQALEPHTLQRRGRIISPNTDYWIDNNQTLPETNYVSSQASSHEATTNASTNAVKIDDDNVANRGTGAVSKDKSSDVVSPDTHTESPNGEQAQEFIVLKDTPRRQ